MADTAAKILKQVDFYFGDSNLPKDKFLKAKISEDKDGYVDISILATFSRMKALSEDVEVIAKALTDSTVVEVSEDGKRVRRKEPLPEHDTSAPRTIYAKGLPEEGTTIDTVDALFSKFGKVNAVRLRRYFKTRKFKGSVFVEFATEDAAKAAVAANGKKEETDGHELIIKSKTQYFADKKVEREEKAKAAQALKDEEFKWEKGCLLAVKNIGAGVDREAVKELFAPHGEVNFVEFRREDVEATIRFAEPAGANKAFDALTASKPKLGEQEIVITKVEGDAETAYWDKVKELMKRKAENAGKKRGGKFQGGGRHKKARH
eukprot:TRINITY_DN5196_c1_g2_i1.p2 TRINITY_DN5196_c1_g2~~TRINITY_DN5196_c1_g2_i1.p2  ORF type:complete len:319 (+),score=141.70 TRINITY_DN5196_c1_g2_i1:82-1038(+)